MVAHSNQSIFYFRVIAYMLFEDCSGYSVFFNAVTYSDIYGGLFHPTDQLEYVVLRCLPLVSN